MAACVPDFYTHIIIIRHRKFNQEINFIKIGLPEPTKLINT